MVLLKKEIEDQQSSFEVLRADTGELSDDPDRILKQVFSKKFMKKYTKYKSIEKFIHESPVDTRRPGSLNKKEFDQFISKNTVFDDWNEMKKKASEEWIVSEIDI